MKLYNFYAIIVNGKWKIYSFWSLETLLSRGYSHYDMITLESKTRYLAKKELASKLKELE